MVLEKSRRRDPLAIGFGRYQLTKNGSAVVGAGFTATLADVDSYLKGGTKQRAK